MNIKTNEHGRVSFTADDGQKVRVQSCRIDIPANGAVTADITAFPSSIDLKAVADILYIDPKGEEITVERIDERIQGLMRLRQEVTNSSPSDISTNEYYGFNFKRKIIQK